MNKKPLREKPWYSMAVAACIAVLLYVFLMRFAEIRGALRDFVSYFSPVIIGLIIAYLVNPLAQLWSKRVFFKIKRKRTRAVLSNLMAFITVLLFLTFLLITLIPQLIDSATTFADNLDSYMRGLNDMLVRWGLDPARLRIDEFINSSEALVDTLTKLVSDNISEILETSATAGKQVVEIVMAFLLSIYVLASKDKLRAGAHEFFKALLKEERYKTFSTVLSHCHKILSRYIVYNLIDCLIVGCANAVFMWIVGLPYVGLVSFVVAIFNLIPTFGPIIGAAIGAFVLVLIKPWYALAFLIFTVVIQTLDAYFIKPKLFGDTLGVSGMWILVGIIVGGRMFGMAGILLAIPAVAILDFLYGKYLLPWLKARRQKKTEAAAAENAEAEEPEPEEEPLLPEEGEA